MDVVNGVLDKVTQWIDTGFSWFGFYSNGYSKYLVYGLLIFLLSKMLKINWKVGH